MSAGDSQQKEIDRWEFFCKEVAKANDILDTIEKLYSGININGNAYNPVFALIIDSLTTKVFLTLGHIFDTQSDSLRLTKVINDKTDIARVKELEYEAEPFIGARNKRHAHLSSIDSEINYKSNFLLMNEHNADKIREILDEVGAMLRRWGVTNNNGAVIADRWGNIESSAEVLIENLKEHVFLVSKMSTYERHENLEKMRKSSEDEQNVTNKTV